MMELNEFDKKATEIMKIALHQHNLEGMIYSVVWAYTAGANKKDLNYKQFREYLESLEDKDFLNLALNTVIYTLLKVYPYMEEDGFKEIAKRYSFSKNLKRDDTLICLVNGMMNYIINIIL